MKAIRFGITLVEILVVFFITLVMAGSVYQLVIASKHTAAVAQAKGEAKGMAETILRAMQRDISASVATVKAESGTATIEVSFDDSATNRWEMLVSEANSSKRITYEWNKPVLKRADASGSIRILCEHVEDLTLARLGVEQVEVNLKVGIVPAGLQQPQIHHQTLLITIQQAIDSNLDARWRTTKDVVNTY